MEIDYMSNNYRPSAKLVARIETESENARLQKRLNLYRFALEEICEIAKREGYTDKDRAVCSLRVAQEALKLST